MNKNKITRMDPDKLYICEKNIIYADFETITINRILYVFAVGFSFENEDP